MRKLSRFKKGALLVSACLLLLQTGKATRMPPRGAGGSGGRYSCTDINRSVQFAGAFGAAFMMFPPTAIMGGALMVGAMLAEAQALAQGC